MTFPAVPLRAASRVPMPYVPRKFISHKIAPTPAAPTNQLHAVVVSDEEAEEESAGGEEEADEEAAPMEEDARDESADASHATIDAPTNLEHDVLPPSPRSNPHAERTARAPD